MAIPSLLGSYIDETYQRLVQTTGSGAEFADGLGNPITFGTTPTGSLLTTASAAGNIITFTKGDGTTFPITVDTGSGGTTINDYVTTSSFNAFTSSIVTTSSFNSWTGSNLSQFAGTSSYALTASYISTLNQELTISGAIRLDPTLDPNPAGNTYTSSSFLFQSSSNTALGYDLYFRQDGNLVKWKWIEGALSTGLLYGGVLSYNNSSPFNIYVSSGSGIVVTPNASIYSEVNPQIKYVTWGNLSASIATGSAQSTYVYIDQYGSLQTQNDFFTPEQYASNIPLGMFNHTGRNLITSVTGDVYTTYNTTNQSFDFIQAFGPLKISGTSISGQTATLRINVSSGESYLLGGFYQQDPNNISHKQTSAYLTASIARVYRSGSTFVTDNNNGSFYTTIDPNNWDNGTGTLTAVGGGSYSIQRVFFNPATGRCHVYYGQNKYNTLAEATTNIATEAFSEANYSSHQYVLAAYLVLKGNTIDLTNVENTIVQAGLFRNTVGSAGGTVIPAKLTDLGDVSISTPTQGQALIYNAGTTKWVNGTPATASYVTGSVFTSTNLALSASSALTASYVNTLNQSVIVSGSLAVSGSTVVRSTLGTGAAFQVLSGSSPILYAGTNISQTRVGIRTSTPLYSFDVNGNANFTPEEHGGYLRISPGQSSTWNNPTFFQTSFGSTLMLNNAYYTASGGQFIRATNGYAAGIQLEPSLGGIELFTAPYGTAGSSFASFTSRITIINSGSVGINNTSPSYTLDVNGSGNYSNGLTVTGSLNAPSITGSLQGTASWTINASTASYVQTASYALNGGVTQIIAGTNITLSPSNGLGAVTINSSGGSGGAGANVSSSFTNQSTWTFVHGLGNRAVVIQTYDTSWNQIIPQNIALTDTNTATITFPSNQSGFAVASVGGVVSTAVSSSYATTSSYAITSLTASYIVTALTASYVVTALTASYVTSSNIVGIVASSSYAATASYITSSNIVGTVTSASYAATSSYVNTLNQNIIITGSVAIGTGSVGTGENNLLLGPAPAGGTGEGGQLALLAVGGTYTSSSFLDNYQNQFRVLAGPGAISNVGILAIDLQTKNATFQGTVTATGYSGLPNDYLYVTRNTDQTVVTNWQNQDIIFNNSVVSKGISYNTSTGLASLTGGKVYRITARLAWSAAAIYTFEYSCYTSANSQIGPTTQIVQSTNGSNNISDGTLDFIYAPSSNTDIKIRTNANTTALSGEKIRGDLNTQLIIQQIA